MGISSSRDEYPTHHGYGDRYGEPEGCIDTGRYGSRYGQSGACIDTGRYDRYNRYGPSAGCIDTGEYGSDRYNRHGHSSAYAEPSRYGHSSRSYEEPGRYGHSSRYEEPGRYGRSGYAESSRYSHSRDYGRGYDMPAVIVPPVVSSEFCVPYMAQFVIGQKMRTLSSARFNIIDDRGRLLFDVESKPFGMHTKRILRDAKGVPLLLLKKMNVTLHDRWEAYRGDEAHDSNLLFIMKKSSMYQTKPSFEVFLSESTAMTGMSKPDFKVKGDFHNHLYTFLHHHRPIAEASRNTSPQSPVSGNEQYGVTVFPGVDHAFIAALIVIVDQVQQDDSTSS